MATPMTVVARLIERLSKELHLTPRQVEILLSVYELGSVTLSDLADLYDVKPSTMDNHILKLMDKGWIEQDDEADFNLFIVDRVYRDQLSEILNKQIKRLKFTGLRLKREHTERQKELANDPV